jgi:predicted lipoprotein with Yx(FWY)xxD motif
MRRLPLLVLASSALAALLVAAPAPASAASLELKSSRYGKVLFDGRNRVLYLFTKEKSKRPRCYGSCASAWPPFVVKSKPKAGKGVRRKLIGTAPRRSGTRQATYRGHPLYYYEHDGPGQILCHDVFEFGGDWLVVNRRGKAAD